MQHSATARSARRCSELSAGRSPRPSICVNQTPTPFLDEKERKKDLAPIINGPVNPAYLEAILRVVNLQLLIAAATPKYVAWRSLALGLTVANPNLGLPETRCVVGPV